MKLRSAGEAITSPYLLQHADNPVDWWTWCEEAFEEARRRDVPIFLSVGYSACHWCHVMAHESFEDEVAAAILNEHCVSIKVDREELPDVDAVYMAATTALTGHGGWPMSVWLDHEGRAFYAGTYFPPQPRHGMPAFTQVVLAVSDAWRNRRAELSAAAERIEGAILEQQEASTPSGEQPPTADQLDAAVEALARSFDHVRGGFGSAPKFPPSMVLEFLLRHHHRTGDPRSLTMVSATCEAMARGGMYDQLGGGFARYSVDADWVVPHFEKMLYDNALLLRVYLNWWRATGDPLGERVARETADFMIRELGAGGGFAAALDADSIPADDPGSTPEEGAFYAWTPVELNQVVGEEDGRWAADLLRVTDRGTFEHGTSTLQLLRDPENQPRWESVRRALFEARESRPRPHRDDKVVASWNGLAIAALAEASMLLDEPRYLEAALSAADLILAVHLGADPEMGDRLSRVSRDGRANTAAPGVLEDYGNVAEGFLSLFQVTGDQEWLVLAGVLLDVALGHFRDGSGFFDTADDQSELVRRPKDATDNASPSGWTAVAGALLTYAAITGSAEHRAAAEAALGVVSVVGVQHPRFMGWGLAVAEGLLDGPREVAILGRSDDPGLFELHRTALHAAAPGQVTVVGPVGSEVPLLRDRVLLEDRATAYVCRGFTCRLPVTTAEELVAQLR